ncbi:MAG: tetratricopeptide repeat protein, partial [Pseudomonadota bacterium]
MSRDASLDSAALKTAQGQMMDGRFENALQTLAPVLDGAQDNVEALYMSAVAQRYLKQFDDALETLSALKALAPELGRAHQEDGHLRRALGDTTRALTAFQRAVRFNPALQASWTAQAELLEAIGQTSAASSARAEAARISSLPKALAGAAHLLYEGKLLKAEEACRAYLKTKPLDTEAMRLLAEIGARFGVLEDAEILLEHAVDLAPDDTRLRLDYIQVLRKRQKFSAALDQARQLAAREPDNLIFQSQLAIENLQTGDYEAALEGFDSVLAKAPHDPATLTSKGHALKTLGRHDDAVAAYRSAYASKPEHGDAYYALANLKTYAFTDDEVAEMTRQVTDGDLANQDRVHFSFALAKAYEDRGDIESAFGHYAKGNALKRRLSTYDADQMDAEFAAQKQVCTRAFFEARKGVGHMARDPIFIVGLPRAGSTLLEQILASHSQIDGTLELPDILSLVHRLRGRARGPGG